MQVSIGCITKSRIFMPIPRMILKHISEFIERGSELYMTSDR